MIVLIDNYDSFTYNLYQTIESCQLSQPVADPPLAEAISCQPVKVQVVRNDQVTCEEVLKQQPSHIILSPGPKTPNESGICIELIRKSAGQIPILGVCLGHQAIAQAFGGKIAQAKQILHGKTSKISHDGQSLFRGLPNPFVATRYHSLAVSEENLPDCLKIVARSEDDEIMALRHKTDPIFGVQFHPESVLTTVGPQLINNFLTRK